MASHRARGLATSVALSAAVALSALACGNAEESGPVPQPLGEGTDLPGATVAPPEEQARIIGTNPRLLLFDLQTAFESVRETRGAYPSEDEFAATDSWALQRAALDEGFDSWTYESDGETYRLSGVSAGRELSIESPQ
jgi:hypothetical protein